MKKYLSTASAVALAAYCNAAYAQTATAPEPGVGIADIIVTAQKRAEPAQKAPLAIVTLDADTLDAAHVKSSADLQRVIPDLHAQSGGGAGDPGGSNTVFTIRGLGASATGPQGSAGVAAHFDGVYRQDGISTGEFYDLERVEVAPGPQGTLYGRSAAAGAINVIPAKPVQKFELAASVGYGNYNALTSEAMINVPLSPTVAFRAAFQALKHDGYYPDGYDALHAISGRAQLLFKPDDALSVRVEGTYTRLNGRGAGNIYVGGPSLPQLAALLPQVNNPDLRQRSINEYCLVNGQLVNTCVQNTLARKYGALADISYDLGGAVLSLVPAYNRTERTTTNANAPIPLSTYAQTPYNTDQYTAEMRLSNGVGSKLKWVIGTNYYENKVDNYVSQIITVLIPAPIPLPSPPFPPGTAVNGADTSAAYQNQHSEQQSYAFFGQATYPITDAIRLTVGGRYNHDKDTGNQILGNDSNNIYVVNGTGPFKGTVLVPLLPAPVATPPQPGNQSFSAVTYRVAIDADVGPASIVYASVGSGYKPGGLNDGGAPASTVPASPYAPAQFFGPERVTHFELGSKNRFFHNTLQINNALYYDDYNNYQNGQTQVVNPLQFGTLGFVVTNAGKAKVYGDELSIKWQPTHDDELSVAVNYLNAHFGTYIAPASLSPNGPTPATDYSGYILANSPDVSADISYRHTFELGASGRLVASAFSHLSDGYWVYFAQADGTYQTSYTSTTLDLTWMSANEHYRISGFVSNLEGRAIKVSGGSAAGYSQVGLAAPRTYGGSLSVKF